MIVKITDTELYRIRRSLETEARICGDNGHDFEAKELRKLIENIMTQTNGESQMGIYRIEYVGKSDKIGGSREEEFECLLDAAKWAESHYGIKNEILSITKIGEAS